MGLMTWFGDAEQLTDLGDILFLVSRPCGCAATRRGHAGAVAGDAPTQAPNMPPPGDQPGRGRLSN
jgi:hypothetical protein